MFLTGYRHFHLKKGKVKQGFIYENAQKKVLENCIFCPRKSLILLNKKVYEPCLRQFVYPDIAFHINNYYIIIPPLPEGGGGYTVFSSPGHRPCELLSWVSVRRPSVSFSHLNLLL